jgi:type VI secretion system secreted protein Hcp
MRKLFVFVSVFLLVSAASNAYSQIYIYFEGGTAPVVKAESLSKEHANETEILSFSSGLTNAVSLSSTGSISAGKVSFSEISFTKQTGKASPALFMASCTGSYYAKAEIRFYAQNPVLKTPYRYQTITLENVYVSSFQQSGSGGERPTESVSLNFAKIVWNLFETDATGNVKLAGTASWNLAKNTAQ